MESIPEDQPINIPPELPNPAKRAKVAPAPTTSPKIENEQKSTGPNQPTPEELELQRKISQRLWPRAKKHPITSAWPLSKFLMTWLSEMIAISKRTPWTQSMHYNLPKSEKVATHKHKLLKAFQTKKSIFGAIWAVYKAYFIEVIVSMFLLAVYSFARSIFSSRVIAEIKKKVDLKNPEILQRMIISLLSIAFITSTTLMIRNYYIFRVERFSLRIRSAVLSVLERKIMRFSVLNSTYFTEGKITNLLQVDTKRVTTFFYEFFELVRNLMIAVVGTGYMAFIAGLMPTLFVVGTFTAIYMVYSIFYYIRSRLVRKFLFFKDKRMSYFQNVLQNIEYVKIRALENFYSTEIFERREKELQAQTNTVVLMSFGSLLDWMADGCATFALIAYYTFFAAEGESIEPEIFFATYLILGLMKTPIYQFTFAVNRVIEANVSFNRITKFLNAVEVSSENQFKELPESSRIALRVSRSEYRWKVEEGVEIKEDENKVVEINERKTRTLNFRVTGRFGASGGGPQFLRDSELVEIEKINLERKRREEGGDGAGEGGGVLKTGNELKTELLNTDEDRGFRGRKNDGIGGRGVRSGPGAGSRGVSGGVGGGGNPDVMNEENFTLRTADIEIEKGEVVVVFGESSSGKSSFLYSLLGEMIPVSASSKIEKSGKICFLSQSRWLIGDTIRENITMGEPYDEEWMEKCLEYSQLVHDLIYLNNGLDTVLGDTSDTVSGGQRARIALSRCFYHK